MELGRLRLEPHFLTHELWRLPLVFLAEARAIWDMASCDLGLGLWVTGDLKMADVGINAGSEGWSLGEEPQRKSLPGVLLLRRLP